MADVKDIKWNPLSFAQLAIPCKKKEVIQALAEAHTGQGSDHTFDDFVPDDTFAVWPSVQLFNFAMLIPLPVGSQASARL